MTAETHREIVYPGVPAALPHHEEDSTTVELHPQSLNASLLRIASVSADQERYAPVVHAATAPPDCHFVSISDSDSYTAAADHSAAIDRSASADDIAAIDPTVSASGNTTGNNTQQQEPAYAARQHPPRVAVHASAVSDVGPPNQAFTISAGPRERKLYYLWSPKSQQPDAAGPGGASYVEALDQGKQQLLKDGSSPFADVTKLQVARMATFLPDLKPKKRAKRSEESWWTWILCQQPFKAKYTIDEEEAQDDNCHPEAPSGWRWKMMLFTCCLIAMISYVDRAAITIALIPMSTQYGWNNATKGAIGRSEPLSFPKLGCITLVA